MFEFDIPKMSSSIFSALRTNNDQPSIVWDFCPPILQINRHWIENKATQDWSFTTHVEFIYENSSPK